MAFHENKHISFFIGLIYLALGVFAVYFGFKHLLPWIMPLFLAFVLSRIIIRPVKAIARKKIMPERAAAAIFTLLIVTFAGAAIFLIVATLIHEGSQLYNSLPDLFAKIPDALEDFQLQFDEFMTHFPEWIRELPLFSLGGILENISLPDVNVSGIVSKIGWAAAGVPTALITTVFIFMGTYFMTADNQSISAFAHRQLGERKMQAAMRLKNFLSSSVLQWIKAQGILICVTFCILLIGFSLLKIPYTLLLAMLIAIIDALPILGVGTVLIPWALISLLTGNFATALFMCLIYAIVLIVRNSIEPHIVGGKIGLNPFVTLLTIYFGFRLAGFAGMFLLPVLVLSINKLQEWGYIRIWK